MHFVRKIEETAEQRALKEKQQMLKVIFYRETRDRIFELRDKDQPNSDKLLLYTAKLLEKNPDLYTMWNIRRKTLDHILTQDVAPEFGDHRCRTNELFMDELALTEMCLLKNSKSYCAWNHRLWVFERMLNPDYAKELSLCQKYLLVDGRNFHCWDHRRMIAKMASVSGVDELKFSNLMIDQNFSNYSAWHYRSSLLHELYNDPNSELCIQSSMVLTEVQKLSNAFFTDPEDQSAWVYAEWLTSVDIKKKKCELLSAVFECEGDVGMAVCTFSHALRSNEVRKFLDLELDGDANLEIFPVSIYQNAQYAHVFRIQFNSRILSVKVKPREDKDLMDTECIYVNTESLYEIYQITVRNVDICRKEALLCVMESCKDLLKELSVDDFTKLAKWPICTISRCLMELDSISNHDEVMVNLRSLSGKLDRQRSALYDDTIKALSINSYLRRTNNEGTRLIDEILTKKTKGDFCVFKGLQIDRLDQFKFLSGFIIMLDLSSNFLYDLSTAAYLVLLTHLILDDNPIKRLDHLASLKRLKFLSVARTLVACVDEVAAIFELPSLEKFIFCETALAGDEHESRKLFDFTEKERMSLRLIRHWL